MQALNQALAAKQLLLAAAYSRTGRGSTVKERAAIIRNQEDLKDILSWQLQVSQYRIQCSG